MVKRYECACDYCEQTLLEDNNGRFVLYEDYQALIQWMKDKMVSWNNREFTDGWMANCDFEKYRKKEEGYEECANELLSKLKELGE